MQYRYTLSSTCQSIAHFIAIFFRYFSLKNSGKILALKVTRLINTYYLQFLFTFSLFIFGTQTLDAQSISGQIINEDNDPIAYANIYVQQTGSGTSADFEGKYFLSLNPGTYEIIVSSLGYESLTLDIVVEDKNTLKNITLQSSGIELDEIIVTSSKKDPAYAIIKNAVDNRKNYLTQIQSSRTKVYLKATEEIENKKKKKDKPDKEEKAKAKEKAKKEKEKAKNKDKSTDKTNDLPDGVPDPFAEEEKRKKELASKLNMIEMEATVNFQYPDLYKEERTAYKVYGQKAGLFVPLFSETNFNFYENMVDLRGIANLI